MIEQIIPKLLEFGLGGILLLAILFAIYKVGIWLSKKGDLLIDSHIQFVNKTDQRLGNIEVDIDIIKTAQVEQKEQNNKQVSLLQQIERNTFNGKH